MTPRAIANPGKSPRPRNVWRIRNLYFRSVESQACAPIYTCHVTRVDIQARGLTVFRKGGNPARRPSRAFRARKSAFARFCTKDLAEYGSESNFFVGQNSCGGTRLSVTIVQEVFEILETSWSVPHNYFVHQSYFQIQVFDISAKPFFPDGKSSGSVHFTRMKSEAFSARDTNDTMR